MLQLTNAEQNTHVVARLLGGKPVVELYDLGDGGEDSGWLVCKRTFETIEKAEAYAHVVHAGKPLPGELSPMFY